MAQARPSLGRERLEELAVQYGVQLQGPPVPLHGLSSVPSFRADNEDSQATQIMERVKTTKMHHKPFLKTKSRILNYTFKNSTAALKEVIEQNGSAGVAEALLNLGGDIGSVRRESRLKQQDEERRSLLLTATRNRNGDLVKLLASRAEQPTKNAALLSALSARHLDMVKILLQYGADPNSCEHCFQAACSRGDAEVIGLLL